MGVKKSIIFNLSTLVSLKTFNYDKPYHISTNFNNNDYLCMQHFLVFLAGNFFFGGGLGVGSLSSFFGLQDF